MKCVSGVEHSSCLMAHNDVLQKHGIKCRKEYDTVFNGNGGFPVAVSLVKYEEDSKPHLSSHFACTILQLVTQNMAKCV